MFYGGYRLIFTGLGGLDEEPEEETIPLVEQSNGFNIEDTFQPQTGGVYQCISATYYNEAIDYRNTKIIRRNDEEYLCILANSS